MFGDQFPPLGRLQPLKWNLLEITRKKLTSFLSDSESICIKQGTPPSTFKFIYFSSFFSRLQPQRSHSSGQISRPNKLELKNWFLRSNPKGLVRPSQKHIRYIFHATWNRISSSVRESSWFMGPREDLRPQIKLVQRICILLPGTRLTRKRKSPTSLPLLWQKTVKSPCLWNRNRRYVVCREIPEEFAAGKRYSPSFNLKTSFFIRVSENG